MIQIELTPDQFAAKCAQLKAEQGLVLTGTCGTLSHGGFAGTFSYDGTTLLITIAKHPFFIPESVIESHLLAWFAGS